MDILDTARKQWCVYWPPAGTDDFNKGKYGTPVNLRVRWDASTEIVKTRDGKDYASRARVMVDRKLLENGVLWLGPGDGLGTTDPLATLDTAHQNDPFKNDGAYRIQRFDSTPVTEPASNGPNDFYRVAFL